jgi:hypothetical protein
MSEIRSQDGLNLGACERNERAEGTVKYHAWYSNKGAVLQ